MDKVVRRSFCRTAALATGELVRYATQDSHSQGNRYRQINVQCEDVVFDLQVSASVTLLAASDSEALQVACLDMFARAEPHQPPQFDVVCLRTSEGAQQLTSLPDSKALLWLYFKGISTTLERLLDPIIDPEDTSCTRSNGLVRNGRDAVRGCSHPVPCLSAAD